MTFIDLFAGIGGFRRGMELAGHKCVGFCEFDKYAVMSYIMMHLATPEQREYIESIPAPPKKNGEPNLRMRQQEILKEEYRNGEWYSDDIRNVDGGSVPEAGCWCFGAPCQDFSVAGKRTGLDGDRSSLIREVFRILGEIEEENRPEWLIYENVKGMLSSNRGFDYLTILLAMDELGYDIEWQLFNSKDWGVPQNRERVYTVGHLRSRGSRKIFPIGETDEVHNAAREDGEIYETAQCLTAGGNDKWQGDYIVKQIGNCMPTATRDNPNQGRIYNPDGIAPCLNKMDEGGREPLIPICMTRKDIKENGELMFTLTGQDRHGVGIELKIKEATKQEYAIAYEGDSINLDHPGSSTRRGRVGRQVANTLDTSCNQGIFVQVSDDLIAYAIWYEKYQCYIAIRKLTPKECFRLQGWEDIYFERAAAVNSDSQLYKQAGNGVTVSVVQAIAECME